MKKILPILLLLICNICLGQIKFTIPIGTGATPVPCSTCYTSVYGLPDSSGFVLVRIDATQDTLLFQNARTVDTIYRTLGVDSIYFSISGVTYAVKDSTGGAGGGVWGTITGTLSDQTDLQAALDGKVNDTGTETIAGVKTFSSNPVLSSISADRVLYTTTGGAITSSANVTYDGTSFTTLSNFGVGQINPNIGAKLHVLGVSNYSNASAISGFFDYQRYGSWDAIGSVSPSGIILAIGGYRSSQWSGLNFYVGGSTSRLSLTSSLATWSIPIVLPSGTASAATAPLKFTSGTLNTTAEAGTQEFNGSFYQTKASGLRYATEGTIADFYTDAANSGTGETDVYSYTTPASTLGNDGEKVFFNYTVNLSDITATATIKVLFAGQTIANTGALTVSAIGAVIVSGWIIRTSSTTARASVGISSPTASTAVYTSQSDLTGLTLSGTNILKLTLTAGGAGGGSGDLTAKQGTVSFRGAAAN